MISQWRMKMVIHETRAELTEMLKGIEKWEKDQKGLWFWEKLARLPFVLLDKLTPKFIHKKIGQAIDELGNFIQSGGKYLLDEKRVMKKYFEEDLSELSPDQRASLAISRMDDAAKRLSEVRANTAMVQGGTTGIGGLFTLAIDIPILLGLILKTIQEVAICYGYNPQEKQERIFIVKCLQFASSDVVGKKAILEELSMFHDNRDNTQMMSQLQGWREVLMTYRDNFGWKKLFQMIPIAGMIFGAFINKSTVKETAEVAMMLYRKRRVLERLRMLEIASQVDSDSQQKNDPMEYESFKG
jgi:hypothetical protein